MIDPDDLEPQEPEVALHDDWVGAELTRADLVRVDIEGTRPDRRSCVSTRGIGHSERQDLPACSVA